MNNKSVLDQFTEIIKDALRDSNITNSKRFQYRLIEILLLIMVIPRKLNFMQLGRYGMFGEQSYRQNFTKRIDWLRFNISLASRMYGKGGRKAIAIDPCFISKAGEHTTPCRSVLVGVCLGCATWFRNTRYRYGGCGCPRLPDAES